MKPLLGVRLPISPRVHQKPRRRARAWLWFRNWQISAIAPRHVGGPAQKLPLTSGRWRCQSAGRVNTLFLTSASPLSEVRPDELQEQLGILTALDGVGEG